MEALRQTTVRISRAAVIIRQMSPNRASSLITFSLSFALHSAGLGVPIPVVYSSRFEVVQQHGGIRIIGGPLGELGGKHAAQAVDGVT